ncbi:hypothetical protein GIB67_003702 [Kingdonia uniflora]|uniref:Uncharacterized protein n=1 Tax=Kingdonia uniflora TaxID=39325 RepID=A0A7J7M447_9MAGN|nr:hypothetical protein GIB67_003702 [Kingdonia uniflora]
MNIFKCKPWGLSLQDCLGWYFRKGQLAFTLCRFGRGPLQKYPSLHYQAIMWRADWIYCRIVYNAF